MIAKNNDSVDPNATALRSPGKLLSRNQSVSSIEEDFLPTFESEDYDWRRFGWLLDEDSNELPCINIEKKPDDFTKDIEKRLPLEIKIPSESDDIIDEALLSNQSVQWSEAASSRDNYSRTLDELFEKGDLIMKEVEGPLSMKKFVLESSSLPETSSEDESCSQKTHVVTKNPISPNEEMSQQETEENTEKDLKRKVSVDDDSCPELPPEKPCEDHASELDDEPVAKRTRRSSMHKTDLECVSLLQPNISPELLLASAVRKSDKRRKGSIRKGSEKEKKYCICQKPYDPTRMYVGCDKCFGWFHPRCAGITEREAVKADHFYCPRCVRRS